MLGKKGKEDQTKKGDEIKITTCKIGENNFNLRYKMWLIICKIQDLEQKELDKYEEGR